MNTKRTRSSSVSEVDVAALADVAVAKPTTRNRARPVAAKPTAAPGKPARQRPAATATRTKAVAAGSARGAARASTAPGNTETAATSRKPVVALPPTPKPVVRRSVKRAPAEPTIDMQVRDAVVARLDAMKANDLKVIDVRGKTSITDYLVIVSGTSTRHVKSMGDEVVVTAKKFGMPPMGIEGEKDAEWMLVDLGDTVVHLMLPRIREFYGLERLWTLAGEARAAAFSA